MIILIKADYFYIFADDKLWKRIQSTNGVHQWIWMHKKYIATLGNTTVHIRTGKIKWHYSTMLRVHCIKLYLTV